MKRIDLDGKSYRVRRGKLVQIPEEWVGKVVSEGTKRRRKKDSRARTMTFPTPAANGGTVKVRMPAETRGQDAVPEPLARHGRYRNRIPPYAREARRDRDREAIEDSEE